MTIESLKALQKRIREATGPDRELDCLIECAIRGGEPYFISVPLAFCQDWRRKVGTTAFFEVSHFTADPDGLGACVELVDTALPNCHWSRDEDGFFWVHVFVGEPQEHRVGGKCLYSRCLMLLDAIISAKIAELEAEQEKERVG